MDLSTQRCGPYLRALSAGLHALAPNDSHVPLAEALAHLQALDPALSGPLLGPGEVDARSGMPAWAWLERARSEAVLAVEAGPRSAYSDEEISRAAALDPALAERLSARSSLHRYLRGVSLLPLTRMRAALRRVERQAHVLLTYDRVAPDGRWLRLGIDLSLPTSSLQGAPFLRGEGAHLDADDGVQHLLTRHATTPLLALQQSLEQALGGTVTRLSRGTIGPFWFPGRPLPEHAPRAAQGALVLHLAQELVASDIHSPVHRDPWQPAPAGEQARPGQALFRERRFAASPPAVEALRAWTVARGAEAIVVPLRPLPTPGRPARRTL